MTLKNKKRKNYKAQDNIKIKARYITDTYINIQAKYKIKGNFHIDIKYTDDTNKYNTC